MADYKLSGLTEATSINENDVFHLRNISGIDKKITKTNLLKIGKEINNKKDLALDTVVMPKFIGDAFTNLVLDPCDLTTGNWAKFNGATAVATAMTINGNKLTKLGSTTGGVYPYLQQNITLPDNINRKSMHIIYRNENITGETSRLLVQQIGVSSANKLRIDINWDTKTVSMNSGYKLDYKWLDEKTVEVWGISDAGETGFTSWVVYIYSRQPDGDSDQFIYATECQLVDSSEILQPFVSGTHSADIIDKEFYMPSQFTIDMIIEPKFLYDVSNVEIISIDLGLTYRCEITYIDGGDKIRLAWKDGGTLVYMLSSQFDDGSAFTNLNQRLRIICSLNLSSGGINDSRFIVIPLESGSVSEKTNWSGTPDVKTSTFPTLSIGNGPNGDIANSDFEYVRIYDGLLVGTVLSSEDATELFESMNLLYEVIQVDTMTNRDIIDTVYPVTAIQRLIDDVRKGVGIQNKAIKPRHMNFPVGFIAMFDGSNWVDNSTMLGWYACIAANASMGAPDMVDKFVMGKVVAGSGATGGSNTLIDHTHTVGAQSANHAHDTVMGSHAHTVNVNIKGGSSGTTKTIDTYDTNYVGVIAIGTALDTDLGTKTSGNQSASHTHTVGSGSAPGSTDSRPAFYSMLFIRKCV